MSLCVHGYGGSTVFEGDCEAYLSEGHLTINRYEDETQKRETMAIYAPGQWSATCAMAEEGAAHPLKEGWWASFWRK